MEENPFYVQKLSLKETALRRAVINLWSEPDILLAIAKLELGSLNYVISKRVFRETVENKVKDKLMKLLIPEALKTEMTILIKPIGSEIRAWKRSHEKYISDSCEESDVLILEKLHWTSRGAIDYQKTAEELVRCQMVDIENSYNIACLNCLEEYIPSIWKELPKKVKNAFYKKKGAMHVGPPYLPYFWPYILKGEVSKLNKMREEARTGFNQYAFENLSRSGNKAAAEYFYHKLTPEEKESSLVRTAETIVITRNIELFHNPDLSPMEKQTEVLYYLLSLMTPEQQMEVLKSRPVFFLRCFLDWPWHDLFLQMASLIWTFLPEEDYEAVLWSMSNAYNRSNYFNPNVFQEFYLHSPVNFKNHFLHESRHFSDFFSICINNKDTETIEIIFGNIDADDKVKLVTSYKFYNIFDALIMGNRWRCVEMCLRLAALSKEDRETLKKTYMEFLTEDGRVPLKPKEWKRFFQMLDASPKNKRGAKNKTPTKSKKRKC